MIHPESSDPHVDYQLWLQTYFLGSALDFFGDVDLALTDEMIKIDPDAGSKAYAMVMKGYPPQPWPCNPPAPCVKTLAEVRELIKLIERVAKEVIAGCNAKLVDAEKLGIEEITLHVRENPGYPRGAILDDGAAAPQPAMRDTTVGSSRK